MNFGSYYVSRIFAFAAIGILMLVIQSVGGGVHQWRAIPSYERLGAVVSDKGEFTLSWWLWPPQIHLSGIFHGCRFRYQKTDMTHSHVMVECLPINGMEISKHRHGTRSEGIPSADLDRFFPGWMALYATRRPVSLRKRSLDRRPLGLGSHPGIDMYRQDMAPFDPGVLQSDLSGLLSFCAEIPKVS